MKSALEEATRLGLDADPMPLKKHGWFNYQHAEAAIVPLLKGAKVIIEIGAWMGLSTAWFVDQGMKVVSVDHWKGSPEHQKGAGRFDSHRVLPTLYEQFISNLVRKMIASHVFPMRMSSKEFFGLPVTSQPRADLIWIDGDHTYEAVREDIVGALDYWCRPRVAGDDYAIDGVKRAVTEVASDRGIAVGHGHGKWWFEW